MEIIDSNLIRYMAWTGNESRISLKCFAFLILILKS